jgi:hypothetical protein
MPPFPIVMKRPYQTSGSQTSAYTDDVSVVLMTRYTRQSGVDTTVEFWHAPGVGTVVGEGTCVALSIVVFSNLRESSKPVHLAETSEVGKAFTANSVSK